LRNFDYFIDNFLIYNTVIIFLFQHTKYHMQTILTTIWPLTGLKNSILTENIQPNVELRGDVRLCSSFSCILCPNPMFFRLMWHNGSHQKCYIRVSRFLSLLSPVTLRYMTKLHAMFSMDSTNVSLYDPRYRFLHI